MVDSVKNYDGNFPRRIFVRMNALVVRYNCTAGTQKSSFLLQKRSAGRTR